MTCGYTRRAVAQRKGVTTMGTAESTPTVYAWGFPPDAIAALWAIAAAAGREIVPLDPATSAPSWGAGAFVLIHAAASASFAAACRAYSLPDGSYPDAALVVTPDAPDTPEEWTPYDVVIALDDPDAVRSVLIAPLQFRAAALADDLSAAFIAGLRTRVALLDLDAISAEDLSAEGRALLTDPMYRRVFDVAVDTRLRRQHYARAPSVVSLAAYVRNGEQDMAMADRLARDPASAAEVAALRAVLAPATEVEPTTVAAPATVGAPPSLLRGTLDWRVSGGEAVERALAAVVEALTALLRPAGVVLQGGLAEAAETDHAAQTRAAIDSLRVDGAVGFEATDAIPVGVRAVRLEYEPDAPGAGGGVLRIGGVRDAAGSRIVAFRAEALSGDRLVRAWESAGGEVEIALADLDIALADGADTLALRA
jgi:hypothetical protein